jgi:uncharacterized protein
VFDPLTIYDLREIIHQTNFVSKIQILFCLLLSVSLGKVSAQNLKTAGVNSQLYVGTSEDQPLIVGLGGSEGGNAWASNFWKPTRDQFLAKGYAFLALGYFGVDGAPDTLDRIAIDQVYHAISEAAKNPRINAKKIAIIGGSRGGDLALLIGSFFPGISCVIALVPAHVSFPGHTTHFSTSAWNYGGKDLPFIPVNEAAVPFLMKGNLRGAFEAMLQDSVAEQAARIKVERINGPVLLISATRDEISPSTPMCDKMIQSFKLNGFRHPYKHLAIEGSHAEPLKHFKEVFEFLAEHFRP